MNRLARALVAAGLAVCAAGSQVHAAPTPLSLTSFEAARTLSAYELSATGIAANAMADERQSVRGFDMAGVAVLPAAYGTALPAGFAASLAVSPSLAFDGGYDLDIASRFGHYDRFGTPLLDNGASFLGLANGGHYAGLTYMPAPDVHLRLGTSFRSDRLDAFSFAPETASGMPLLFDPSQTRSLLAGASWDFSDWASIGVNAISSSRSGIPLGYPASARITSRAETDAFGFSARFGLGNGWVTTADFTQGFSQLDQRRSGMVPTQSYSVTVAKRGLFGGDMLGFSLARPAPGTVGGFAALTASGDLPPLILAQGQTLHAAPETDFQLGYVTSFLNGTLALQTNAAYEMNYQGQTGATAVSLLSRAKIKF